MKITIEIPRNDLNEFAVANIVVEVGNALYTMENGCFDKNQFTELQDGSYSLQTSYGEIFFTPENNVDNSPENN